MRILQLGKFFPPDQGGIETVTLELARGLTAAGARSDVLCFNTAKGPGSVTDMGGYTVYRASTPKIALSTPLSLEVLWRLHRLASQYDILHVHCPNPMAFLALFLLRPRLPWVLHWHSDVIRQKNAVRLFRPLERFVIRRAARVVGATPAHIQASPHRALMSHKAAIIPFCIDPAPFDPANANQQAKQSLAGRFPGKKAVFALGRLIYYKGFSHLVEAARLLPDDWVVLIGGEGPDKAELARQIEALNLSGKVHLLGPVPQNELAAHYAFCRVFCLPSTHRSEMFGMVQLEAMASGRPIVSTDIPGSGVPFVNQHQVTGLVVPPGDSAALAQAILAIDADQARYQAMSRACLNVFTQRFSPPAVVEALLACYRQVLLDGSLAFLDA